MRTAIVLVLGLALAIGFAIGGRALGGRTALGAIVFALAWLAFCFFDYTRGVAAGYAPSEEMRIHALLFVIPAAGSWLAVRLLR